LAIFQTFVSEKWLILRFRSENVSNRLFCALFRIGFGIFDTFDAKFDILRIVFVIFS